MCSFLIRDKNAEARDKNQFKYRHTNCVFNPPDGKYIVRSDPVECLIASQRQFWQAGPHAITHKPRATIDHSAKPTFKTVNWSGGAGGGHQLRKKSPLGTVRYEFNSPKPVFKTVNWNGGGNPVRSESPRGTTFRLQVSKPTYTTTLPRV